MGFVSFVKSEVSHARQICNVANPGKPRDSRHTQMSTQANASVTVAPEQPAPTVEIKATPALISAVKASIQADAKVIEAQRAAESKLWLVADALKKAVHDKAWDKKQARLAVVDAYKQANGSTTDSTISRILSNSAIWADEKTRDQIEAARKEGFGWNKVASVASGSETVETLKEQREKGKEAMKRTPRTKGDQTKPQPTATASTPTPTNETSQPTQYVVIEEEVKSSPITLLRANITRALELALRQGLDQETIQETLAECFAEVCEQEPPFEEDTDTDTDNE